MTNETTPQWVKDQTAFRRRSPEAEALYRLLMAVEHYDRMGWLAIPESDRWKFDDLMADVRELCPW